MKLSGLGRYSKFATAVAGQALVYAQFTYGADNRWVQLATAAAAAIAVYAVPNAAKVSPPSPVSPPAP
jgi:hypothetical protein